jgi:hypothetical protein
LAIAYGSGARNIVQAIKGSLLPGVVIMRESAAD